MKKMMVILVAGIMMAGVAMAGSPIIVTGSASTNETQVYTHTGEAAWVVGAEVWGNNGSTVSTNFSIVLKNVAVRTHTLASGSSTNQAVYSDGTRAKPIAKGGTLTFSGGDDGTTTNNYLIYLSY